MENDKKIRRSILVFDLDGVLRPIDEENDTEKPFKDVPKILTALHKNYIICIASFNPGAKMIIDSWKLKCGPLAAYRCGANQKWDSTYNSEWKETMSKSKMIQDMIHELGLVSTHTVQFFDDDQGNVDEVNCIDYMTAFHVDPTDGLTWSDVSHLILK